jgi:pyrimidine operon attenuation protein/uracil phosphoribosyltransferase
MDITTMRAAMNAAMAIGRPAGITAALAVSALAAATVGAAVT